MVTPPYAPARTAGTETAPPLTRSQRLSVATRRALGTLAQAIDHPDICDLLLHVRNGKGEAWLDIGGTPSPIPNWECSPDTLHSLARALIAAGGRHLDERHPIADVHLGQGIRVHAVLPPVSVHGASISIRVPREDPLSLTELIRGNLCRPQIAQQIRAELRKRSNILVTGGTGTGKTTLLAALLDESPPHERIITIEDLAELQLRHPHHIALEARQDTTEGIGRIDLNELLRAALRMRPDRIVLGECRGAELATLLAALNTGHDGGCGSLHASRMSEVPARLEALGALAGLSPEALARQVTSAIHLIVHLQRDGDGVRRITQLGKPMLSGRSLHIETV